MAEKLTVAILSLWLFQAVLQSLNWAYWLQTKEYRFDRFKILFFTQSGRRNLYFWLILFKFLFFALYFLTGYLNWALLIFLSFIDVVYIKDVLRSGIRRPVFTERIKRILLISFVSSFLGLFLLISKEGLITSVFIAELGLMVGLFLGTLVTQLVSDRIKNKEAKKAREILDEVKPFVVGITGSYGKTTTKDLVASLLEQSYEVAKTHKNENTEFGVIRSVLAQVKKETKYFVSEMGAYKKGEIKKICELVKPQIGIITGIDSQHIDLFGSLENIKKAKFEIIESLPKGGTAIFNLSNRFCRELYKKAKGLNTNLLVLGYSGKGIHNSNIKPDITTRIISATFDKVKFEVNFRGDKKVLLAYIHGTHFVENLACAILVARLLDVGWDDIEKGCLSLEVPDKTMSFYKKDGSIFIDDSYNANYKGFFAAISYLSMFKNLKKVLVTGGIIELGKDSSEIHTKLGREMEGKFDKIFLTSEDFVKEMKEGLGKDSDKVSVCLNPKKLKEELTVLARQKYLFLFEGKQSKMIQNFVEENK